MATVYSATALPVDPVPGYQASCVLTQGNFYQHTDHTQARKVWVKNTTTATYDPSGPHKWEGQFVVETEIDESQVKNLHKTHIVDVDKKVPVPRRS